MPVHVRLEPYVGRLVTVNAVIGDDTLAMLFDTGGGETLITPEVARRIGCSPAGRSVGFRMTGERVEFASCSDVTLDIAGQPFPHAEIGVFDIAALLPPDWPPLAGVLSLETFEDRVVTIDLAHGALTLETESSGRARITAMRRVPARFASGTDGRSLTVLLKVDLPGQGWYLLDSGNLDAVIVGQHVRVAGGSPPDAAVGMEGDVRLEAVPTVRARWRVGDIIYDGALSEAFMRQLIFTIDPANRGVWVAAGNGGSS